MESKLNNQNFTIAKNSFYEQIYFDIFYVFLQLKIDRNLLQQLPHFDNVIHKLDS